MNEKLLVVCDECNKNFEMLKNSIERRKERYGKILCMSCSQKGERNPIFNRKGILSYKEKREKINTICTDCGKEYCMTHERILSRREKYGKDLCLSCSKIGERNPFYNKRFTSDQLQLFSSIRKSFYNDKLFGEYRRAQQSLRFMGKDNPMYKEDVEKVNWRSRCLRELVLKVNNYTCQKCKTQKHPLELDTHHIVSINHNKDKRIDIENTACLCVKCHRAFHMLYGWNTISKDFESFIESSETIETMLEKHNGVE
ncbi:HNH endonuclease [Candidatus Clostridium stratigraminis]|uniref:HNH endonuclease n=1 Tax=Candidatus Clostridium stratigraminis TaxID=3381661 RepID=A0ABW8T8V7_9CLOT